LVVKAITICWRLMLLASRCLVPSLQALSELVGSREGKQPLSRPKIYFSLGRVVSVVRLPTITHSLRAINIIGDLSGSIDQAIWRRSTQACCLAQMERLSLSLLRAKLIERFQADLSFMCMCRLYLKDGVIAVEKKCLNTIMPILQRWCDRLTQVIYLLFL
jgi:hypothetical protein